MQNIYIYITLNIFNVASLDKNPKALYVNYTVSIQKLTQSLPCIGRNYNKCCQTIWQYTNSNIHQFYHLSFKYYSKAVVESSKCNEIQRPIATSLSELKKI